MMNQEGTAKEEITTIENQSPQKVVKTTTTPIEPEVKTEHPQKVYEKKKTIFRFNQIIWYVLGLVEVLLIFRVVLKAVGANPNAGFTNLIYAVTAPLAVPFNGILGAPASGNSVIEFSTIIAAVVYLCIAWGFVYLMDLIYPITPKDVEVN